MLKLRNHLEYRMFVGGLPYLSADPEFSIIHDRCGDTMEQTMYAVRVISTYVTFYKTVIPVLYFKELSEGLPKEQSIEILKWPGENIPIDDLNLGKPEGKVKYWKY
ncbi:hypothetical protein RclHR1_02010011 [Rhizophagus clarus]|uniref:Uncharacterized protein n=1 Tax=Rhizophagus clarus TaxID=94130 RepID=A0A2Z6R450_9GLOM|nr:hypothetical protein RclHR1_02010011 [Rhizophagus clarus]